MPRIGVVGTRGGWSSELLADTIERMTGFRLLVEMDKVRLDLPGGRVTFQGVDLGSLDGLMVKKIGARYSPDLLDRLEVLRFLSARGLPVFSDPNKIMRVLDRLSCTVSLQLAGVPMPPTTITEDVDQAWEALKEYGRAVLKPLYSTKARGMIPLDASDPGAQEAIRAHKAENTIIYLQQRVDLNGRDLCLVFMGGRYLTTYARCKTNGAWNTTTASGGEYAPFDPDPAVIALAHKAQEGFGLDFTGVDVALTEEGPLVFEVSAFGGFKGVREASGIDAAEAWAAHVLDKLGRPRG